MIKILKISQLVVWLLNKKRCWVVSNGNNIKNNFKKLFLSSIIGIWVFIFVWSGLNVPAEGATIHDFYSEIPYFDSLDNLEMANFIESGMYSMLLFFALTLTLLPLAQWGLDILFDLLFIL
jgi:hypothetical protein